LISLITIKTRLVVIAQQIRAANREQVEAESLPLLEDLRRACKAIYPNVKEGRTETRVGAPAVYVQNHEKFGEILEHLTDALRLFHQGDIEAAIASVDYCRSICGQRGEADGDGQ